MLRRLVCGLIFLLILIGFRGSAGPLPGAGFLQDMPFRGEGKYFGGFSALHIAPDGGAFIAVSDRGSFVSGQFLRDAGGRILSIRVGPPRHLLTNDGKWLTRGASDSEGLAIAADGTAYVSFEGPALVRRYPMLGQRGSFLPVPGAFFRMDGNRALEALTIDSQGTLYTIPEESTAPDRPFPVYRYRDGHWDQPFDFPRRGNFLVSDASIGPDGRLYVLEREFLGLAGFATRLRRFDLTPQGLSGERTLVQTTPGTFDNLEGLAVWRAPDGLRATMVSDDNFLWVFRSQIVEYRLPD